MYYSIIIPVYNRPNEVKELLDSLALQSYSRFEVIIVEDGSTISCRHIVKKYISRMDIAYYYKKNSGPGLSRNFGACHAKGDYLLFFDSDCTLPPSYLQKIQEKLLSSPIDIFGGTDKADETFTPIQKAINYSMTSFLTTGGIRGGHQQMDTFYPRSFNLGIKETVFKAIGGFSDMRFGEDLDLSIRVMKTGYTMTYVSEAWVYHKRRTGLKQFYKQVYNSGSARINLQKKHPGTLKCIHTLPSLFTVFCMASVLLIFHYPCLLIPIMVFASLLFIDAFRKTKEVYISFLAIMASLTQLIGYGAGMIAALFHHPFQRSKAYSAFKHNFYK